MMTILLTAAAAAAATQQASKNGAELAKRCAACHSENGAGYPGMSPPLRENVRRLATSGPGRRYLSLVVVLGNKGPIEVDGKAFNGEMPAQGLSDEEAARVLNRLLETTAAGESRVKPFTAREITRNRRTGRTMRPEQVSVSRPAG